VSPPTPHWRAAFLAAFLLLLPQLSLSSPHETLVTGIRFWSNEEYTRVAVDLEDEARYEANFLPADPGRNLPPRIFIDIRGADIKEEILKSPVQVRNGLLRTVRAGRFRKGVVRVVVDLERESTYRVFSMTDPFRVIFDIDGKADPAVPPGNGSPQDTPEPRPAASPRKVRVMLDPGHGGKDPGAPGPKTTEAEVVLDVALRLEKLLAASPGIEVVLTRRDDTFVPLEERTALANRQSADLFVSIHANSSRNRKAAGVETYVLNFATSADAEAVAARENATAAGSMRNLPDMVKAITQNNKRDESRELADAVQQSLVAKLRPHNPPLRDLGVKQAPFVVLIGAGMPSILAEIAFISHEGEGGLLKTAAYRQRIAEALGSAILRYTRTLKPIGTVASQDE
jgi:N-acetylmuramoyl-L-alanine amidase